VIYGGPGADDITGGPGADLVDAGPGNDRVDVRDRFPDQVNMGTGDDSILLDRGLDRVRNAERAADPAPGDLARGRPVSASLSLPDRPAERAVDGRLNGYWGGFYAPQWIEIDLGRPEAVDRITLAVAQFPDGLTDHVILGKAKPDDRWHGLAELKGVTHDGEVLTATARRPWTVEYVRVETRTSPSWVAWKEIAVFAY
jgi:F5/8 type C domain/RTX calcium-binding nonapeptide repeat (4 copies)